MMSKVLMMTNMSKKKGGGGKRPQRRFEGGNEKEKKKKELTKMQNSDKSLKNEGSGREKKKGRLRSTLFI